jgi:hypothetical protein
MGLFIPQMIYEHEEPWQNDIDGKTVELGEKPVPVSYCPPKIPGNEPGLCNERPATNRLSHGTAYMCV